MTVPTQPKQRRRDRDPADVDGRPYISLTSRITADDSFRLDQAAAARGITRNEMIRRLIRRLPGGVTA